MSTIQQFVIGIDESVTVEQLARVCGRQLQWVNELAQIGIIRVMDIEQPMQTWRLDSADLLRARTAERLQRDLEANLDTAALILDLQDEVQRLKSMLSVHRHLPVIDV